MRNKYFYPIFKLKAKSWIRYWLLKKTEFKGKLSDILTGFSFNLQNTLRQKFVKFEIEGHSIQDGTPSPENEVPILSAGENVNLFDKENVSNGYLKSDGTIQTASGFKVSDYIDVSKYDNVTVSGNKGAGEVNCFYDENKTFLTGSGMASNTTKTYSIPNNAKYIRVTVKDDVLDQYKLEQGSIATPYSPYGMGSITEKIVNGNLWTSEWEQGYIDANGGLINNNAHIRTKDYIYFEPGQHYAIKRSIYTTYMNVRGYDKNKKFVGIGDACINLIQGSSTATPMNTINTCVISTKPGIYYLKFNDASNDLTTQYMMVKGDTPEDYIESEEQTYSVYTQQPFRSIGDVRDVFFKNTVDSPYYDENLVENGWYERHLKWFRVTKDMIIGAGAYGVNSWIIGSPTLVKYIENTISCKCNYFRGVSFDDRTIDENNIVYSIPNGTSLQIRNTEFATIEALKTFLDENEVYVEYVPVKPTNLLCTQSQIDILENLPITYEGQTNVYSTDEVEPYLKIQYWESDTNG